MSRLALVSVLASLFLLRTESPGSLPSPLDGLQVLSTEAVTPELARTAGVAVQAANNNLDVVKYGGRVYLAFRTAPNHFASRDTHLYVVSSADERNWQVETKVALGSDLREPRLLAVGNELFLYFAVLGHDLFHFEPQGMMAVKRGADGTWSAPRSVYRAGYIPWRTRTVGGVPYMVAYGDGRHIYERDGVPIEVHWLTTDDGWQWRPVVAEHPAVLKGGGSEADFIDLPDGGVVAVIRNEAGDGEGWGSKVCRGDANDRGKWRCVQDKRKFDSPLLFRAGGEVFLAARRHLNRDGAYDLGLRRLPASVQTALYQLDYWRYPKRCAIWRVDAQKLQVAWQADLPSRGDTCFPGVVEGKDGNVALYNYSSPIDGADVPWLVGQLGTTSIYRSILAVQPRVAIGRLPPAHQ